MIESRAGGNGLAKFWTVELTGSGIKKTVGSCGIVLIIPPSPNQRRLAGKHGPIFNLTLSECLSREKLFAPFQTDSGTHIFIPTDCGPTLPKRRRDGALHAPGPESTSIVKPAFSS